MALATASCLITISGIFQASQAVLGILNELPVEKGRARDYKTPSDLLGFSGVKVDDEGNAVVDHEIVVNQQACGFGEKFMGLVSLLLRI